MSEMKTIMFPGDSEPREIVDAKARETIAGKLPMPTSAEVGQIIQVSAVDENGTITATEAVENTGGGATGVEWDDIKNKPFYETETEVIPLATVETVDAGNGMPPVAQNVLPPITFAEDYTYRVTFDGTEYECTPIEERGVGYIGYIGMMHGSQIGAEFPFIYGSDGTNSFIATVTAGEHTVKIVEKAIVPLPHRFLPKELRFGEKIASEGDVVYRETFTTEDWGTFGQYYDPITKLNLNVGQSYTITFDDGTGPGYCPEPYGIDVLYIGSDPPDAFENEDDPLHRDSFTIVQSGDEGLYILTKTPGEHTIEIVAEGDIYGTIASKHIPLGSVYTIANEVVDEALAELPEGGGGEDGVSPTVETEAIEGGHRVTFTDVNGEKSIDVMNGKDGPQGEQGPQGPAYTLTDTDKNTIVNSVIAALPTWTGGSY